MTGFLSDIDWQSIFTMETLLAIARVAAVSLAGFILIRLIVLVVRRVLSRRSTAQVTMLVTKSIGYIGFAVVVTFVLLELGVNLTPILGAAGIVGLAVGIASQASLSNIISGLFLVSEKPFQIGDVVKIGDTSGIVDSIDLLSVKLRTFDNLYIRVPNEKIASSQLTNITRYPIRRMNFTLTVPHSVDLDQVREILVGIANENVLCLQEPEPIILFGDFLEMGCSILFGVWFQKSDYVPVKNSVFMEIRTRLTNAGIPLAIPRRSLVGEEPGEPIQVRMVGEEELRISDVESAPETE